jgi:hypothetical protein
MILNDCNQVSIKYLIISKIIAKIIGYSTDFQ